MPFLFEQPCLEGWVYPCSLEDIAHRISQLPPEDIEGLWAIGLVSSTRKNYTANARYRGGQKPTICIYSHAEGLQFKLPPHMHQADIEFGLCMEIDYGMNVERQGGRYFCKWLAADLRLFIPDHVLTHKVGHHVYHNRRRRLGLPAGFNRTESEQFAEAYAVRHHIKR